ncbi:hypothetical protein [Stratiformator vulcanicus]|uniref:DUF3592 domain-containing protein n=1 Tax=Stratiformator vulcanicus TaxID=2527980 RepID=A0A517R0T9_9PLAN|nr:hypothetical protein [Stratiformator vulcanicus]QDT37488.1 hypothetical protein Pan189_18680 [Stratiformator vulcanicus]
MLNLLFDRLRYDEDERRMMRAVRFWGFVLVLSLFVGYYGLKEVRYRVFGTRADAKVTSISQPKGKDNENLRRVRFSIETEDEANRRGEEVVGKSWTPPGRDSLSVGDSIEVVFLWGVEESSRPAGTESNFVLVIFLIAVTAITLACIFFWQWASKQANYKSPQYRAHY